MSTWEPDWTVPPGDILQEMLEDRGISQTELAERMERPVKTIDEIIHAKAQITPETAVQLERVLGVDAEFWLNLETMYRLFHARRKALLSGPEPPFPLTERVPA